MKLKPFLFSRLSLFFYCSLFLVSGAQAQRHFKVELTGVESVRKFVLYNTAFTYDSLVKYLVTKSKLSPEFVVVNELEYIDGFLTVYEAGEAEMALGPNKSFYFIVRGQKNTDPYFVGYKLPDSDTSDIAIELQEEDIKNIVVKQVKFDANYKMLKANVPLKTFNFNGEEIAYKAKNRLTPEQIKAYVDEITVVPEDRKINLEFKVLFPEDLISREDIIMEIITVDGHAIRLFDPVKEKELLIVRGNLDAGRYMMKIYDGERNELKRMMLHMQPLKVKEEK